MLLQQHNPSVNDSSGDDLKATWCLVPEGGLDHDPVVHSSCYGFKVSSFKIPSGGRGNVDPACAAVPWMHSRTVREVILRQIINFNVIGECPIPPFDEKQDIKFKRSKTLSSSGYIGI